MPMTKKILIVDDERNVIELLSVNLLAHGFKVISAEDGEEGLNKAFKEFPDLILLDMRLPKLNGLELCERLKADKRTKHIPLFFLTAAAQREDVEKAISAGSDCYFTKPFDIQHVIQNIKKITA